MGSKVSNKRGQRGRGSKGYLYFIWDRKTGQWGIYRFIKRLCHEFGIDYIKLKSAGFVDAEFYDDGRYIIAGAPLEIRGLAPAVQNYDCAIKTLYDNAAKTLVARYRLEDIKKNRFKNDKAGKRRTRHYYKR